ncbi:MAG TPA: DEAD/DEAH box helicase, partial [Verrucomicrobiae bacterium]|nr:DEAD/DEAH box helicase [Verrucomicrobiae bacterium]
VLVPDFWHQKKNRLGMRLELKSSSASGKGTGLEALLDYDWQVLAGGQELTLEEFRALVELRMPLLKIRGAWVEIREQEIENALVFFQGRDKAPRRAMPVREALHAALEGDLSETGLPVVDVRAEGWIRHLLSASALEFPRVEIPEGFKGELRPYQHKGFSWLCFMREKNLGACLADDMGLGKTVQMITHFLREKNPAAGRRTVLIVCPMSIVRNWEKEIARFAPALGVAVHHGADRLTGAEFGKRASASDIVITTYGLVLRDQDLFSRLEWDLVVLDEAQNIKNDEARQTRAVKALRAKSRMALTGTPLENRLSELWSIMDFLNPGYLGLAAEFRTRFELPIENRRDAKKADTLKRLIGPFFLRRLKTDKSIIQDLPEKMEMKVYCNLTREQATLYAAAVQEMFAKAQNASGIQRKGIILAGLMKLKQVCNHPAQILRDKSALGERSGKLNRLRDMLEEVLAEGDKALVFTQFAEMGALLKPELEEKLRRRVLFLHGGSDAAEREEMIGLFQETQDYPIFILSTRAGGLGINLTAASHVFHYDRWWNPAVENQATDRAFRIGQTRNVQVHKFIAAGTLEEKIDDLLERKAALADKIMGGLEEFLTEIPIEELKEIVELGGGAVAE